MSYLHFQYAVEIRRVLKQAQAGITRADLYDRVHVDDKSEQRFGETLAELCQGRNPDVVIAIADGEPSTYSLSLDALTFSRRQELPSTHVIPRRHRQQLTPTPKPKAPPLKTPPPAPVISRDSGRGTRWKPVKVKAPPSSWRGSKRNCETCGAEIDYNGRGRPPRFCRVCKGKPSDHPLCPTCGQRIRKPPKPKEQPT